MRLLIIRHAEPDYANNTITPPGHLEAKALAKRLKSEGIDRIYCSPLGRALHTMQYTAELTGVKPEVEPWTAELEGWRIADTVGAMQIAWDVCSDPVRGSVPLPSGDNWHRLPPFDNPEFYRKFEDIKRNSDRFLERLGYRRRDGKYEVAAPNRECVAVFCHMGFGLAWLAHLLELPLPLVWSGFWLAPSSVSVVLLEERPDGLAIPRCLGLGDTSHLYESGVQISRAGLKANFD